MKTTKSLNMTLEEFNLLMEEGDPLMPKDFTWEQFQAMEEHREQVRQRCVAEYSSSPLWMQRAEKDPEYWKTFYVGRHNL